MRQDLARGDAVIRSVLASLAASKAVSHAGIELHEHPRGVYTYTLLGTAKSVSLREREIRYAADAAKRAPVLARLDAMFEELWWGQALVLLGLRGIGRKQRCRS